MEEDVELIILDNSKRVIGKNYYEKHHSFVKIGEAKLFISRRNNFFRHGVLEEL